MRTFIVAGFMCLGLVTLGVVGTYGEDAANPRQERTEVVNHGAGTALVGELVTVDLGNDAGLEASGDVRVHVDNGDVEISSDDGRSVEIRRARIAPHAGMVVRTSPGTPVADPQAREALEKLIAGLKDDAKRLEGEGKKEEAARKLQSVQALERILSPQPIAQFAGRGVHFTGPGDEEIKKLESRRDELAKKLAEKPDAGADAIANVQHELAEIERAIAVRRQQLGMQGWMGAGFGVAPGGFPGAPGMPGARGVAGHVARFGFGPAKSAALSQQAAVLTQAAAQLRAAGLPEQAQQLADQAEKVRDQAQKMAKEEAEQMQSQAHARFGGGGMAAFGGAPHVDLQRSIKELQEQVQQLRKEVAEVRELLQQKR